MSRSLIQLVREDKSLNSNLKSFIDENIEKSSEKGFNYHVVSVFGSQSTGKSTLLNRVFGTGFEVMDEAQRKQTTRGIWLSHIPTKDILVLDVEGTDGRERGEDQDFERKSALFSLAISEVLIINMWENMVGLYQGANMGLLKTVLDVNAQLFQSAESPKTLLLFCIRDFTGKTPSKNLEAILASDLNKMWGNVSKPDAIRDLPLDAFFRLEFVFLPHKIYAEVDFERACTELGSRFTRTGLLKADQSKGIPLDGFSKYVSDIWDTIIHNRDLDLPTQQQLLAQFRCDEIARGILDNFTINHEAKFKSKLERGEVIRSLGQDMLSMRKEALAQFETDASRYNRGVFNVKLAELRNTINRALSVYFLEQIRNLIRVAKSEWTRKVGVRLQESPFQFQSISTSETRLIMSNFKLIADAVVLPDTEWTYADQQAQFEADIESIKDEQRKQCLRLLLSYTEKQRVLPHLEVCIETLFSSTLKPAGDEKPEDGFWLRLYGVFDSSLRLADTELTASLREGFASLDDEVTALVAQFEAVCLLHLRKRLALELGDNTTMVARLRRTFEDVFRFDERGLPRFWSDTESMDALYEQAKAAPEALLKELCKMRFPQERVTPMLETLEKLASKPAEQQIIDSAILVEEILSSGSKQYDRFTTLIPSSKYMLIWNQLQRDISLLYVEAKQSLIAQPPAKIPNWLVAMLLVLGWNEFVAILSSPIYFITLAVIMCFSFVVYKSGMAFPLIKVALAAWSQLWYQIKIALALPQQEQFTSQIPRAKPSPTAKDVSTALAEASQPSSVAPVDKQANVVKQRKLAPDNAKED